MALKEPEVGKAQVEEAWTKASRTAATTTEVVVVAHGDYGRALVSAAEQICGRVPVGVVEVSDLDVPQQVLREEIERCVQVRLAASASDERQVLLVVDLIGSTPAKICQEIADENAGWAVVTDLSLPVLLRLAMADRRLSASELKALVLRQEGGRR